MSAKREVTLRCTHVRCGARERDARCEGAIRCARVRRGVPVRYGTRGRDAEREGAMRNARTHLCQIICQKGVYITLKTSISCRLLDLGVFFASHLADYLT